MEGSTAKIRPYRSKVTRPCDRCRRRKTTCILPADGPCRSCNSASQACTFELPPAKRKRGPELSGSTVASPQDEDGVNGSEPVAQPRTPQARRSQALRRISSKHAVSAIHISPPRRETSHGLGDIQLGMNAEYNIDSEQRAATSKPNATSATERLPEYRDQPQPQPIDPVCGIASPAIQHVRSLDQIEGATAQLCGISAELDPWLLRHCRYDDYGMCHLHGTLIRNVGGVPVMGLVPVHFVVAKVPPTEPVQPGDDPIGIEVRPECRDELNKLIPPTHATRFLSLCVRTPLIII